MAATGVAGYGSRQPTITTGAVSTMQSLGYTDEQLTAADSVHIQAKNGNVNYWYDGTVPTTTEGYTIYEGQSTIVRMNMNVRRLKIVAESGSVMIAITLGTFGRIP